MVLWINKTNGNSKKIKYRILTFGTLILFGIIVIIGTDLVNLFTEDAFSDNDAVYIFPPINSFLVQKFILNCLILVGVVVGIILGLIVAYFLTFIILWFVSTSSKNKIMKRLVKPDNFEFGFVKIEPSLTPITTILLRAFFMGFFTMSILFVFVENDTLSSFFWIDLLIYQTTITNQTFGIYSEDILLPWSWISVIITFTLSIACWIILDSGLIVIRKKSRHLNYKNVSKVGDIVYKAIKGYVGISIILSWILFIFRINTGITVFPMNAFLFSILILFILDWMRPFSNKLIKKAITKNFPNIKEFIVDIEYSDS